MAETNGRRTDVRQKDYDADREGRPIRVKMGGEWYEYPPEAPIDIAIGWMDRQAAIVAEDKGGPSLNESGSERTLNNYRSIIGTASVEAMQKSGKVSLKALDDLYADLLDWWNLWDRPGETELDEKLDRLQVMVTAAVESVETRTAILIHLKTIRDDVAALQEEAEDADEEETAANPT